MEQISSRTGLPLKEALFLGFCAVFIIITKAALRLKLNISGHSMLFMTFFLLMARGCVIRYYAATFTSFIAGVMAIMLGLGKGGPLMLIKFLLPGITIDIICLIMPFMFKSIILCAIAGALAGASKIISTYLVDFLMGMNKEVILQHVFIKSFFSVIFGIIGALPIPSVIRKLKAFGAIDHGG